MSTAMCPIVRCDFSKHSFACRHVATCGGESSRDSWRSRSAAWQATGDTLWHTTSPGADSLRVPTLARMRGHWRRPLDRVLRQAEVPTNLILCHVLGQLALPDLPLDIYIRVYVY
jgi:hypothetical protein